MVLFTSSPLLVVVSMVLFRFSQLAVFHCRNVSRSQYKEVLTYFRWMCFIKLSANNGACCIIVMSSKVLSNIMINITPSNWKFPCEDSPTNGSILTHCILSVDRNKVIALDFSLLITFAFILHGMISTYSVNITSESRIVCTDKSTASRSNQLILSFIKTCSNVH